MANQWTTKNGMTSKRGLFSNGMWQCDCEPRLPAEKFQVKNGGKNHGRWFYTCQKSQPKRCPFFLWSDDAKVREEAAVLSNSRNEPRTPYTPMRQLKLQGNTPRSRVRSEQKSKAQKIIEAEESDDEFEWDSDIDEVAAQVAEQVEQELSPRKVARTVTRTSPGIRQRTTEIEDSSQATIDYLSDSHGTEDWPERQKDTVFTPSTPSITQATSLMTPNTASDARRTLFPPSNQKLRREKPGELAMDVLNLLSPVAAHISEELENQLVGLLNQYALKTRGIGRGRDVVRTALQTKEKKTAELSARIVALESECENNKTVIASLRSELAGKSTPRGLRVMK